MASKAKNEKIVIIGRFEKMNLLNLIDFFSLNYGNIINIVFSGLIGQSWAMIFASVGYKVSIFDIIESQVSNGLKQTEAQLKSLEEKGLLRGNFTAEEQFSFIEGCTDLSKALDGAFFLQGKNI